MISKLTGKVDHIYSNSIILDVSNVGYEIFCLSHNVSKFSIGQILSLFIITQIKDQQYIELFGFSNTDSKEMFLLLRSVNGVGSKVAMMLLDYYSENHIKNIINEKQKSMLTKITGIGEKLAERIILELKNKIKDNKKINKNHPDAINTQNEHIMQDAINALTKLGISNNDAKYKVYAIQKSSKKILSTEELIKFALS